MLSNKVSSRVIGPGLVASLVREALERGSSVHLEGLGIFCAASGSRSGYRFVRQTAPKIFIAYVREDAARASRLFDELAREGFDPWMDRHKLLPGQNWPRAIENAIEVSDFVIICFSQQAIKKRGGFQAELRFALECARRTPLDAVYLVPVRLDQCRVPSQVARHIQYVDMFPNWDAGRRRLLRVLRGARTKVRAP